MRACCFLLAASRREDEVMDREKLQDRKKFNTHFELFEYGMHKMDTFIYIASTHPAFSIALCVSKIEFQRESFAKRDKNHCV